MIEFISASSSGIMIQVHVKPFSKNTKISNVRNDGKLVIDLAAKPKDGEANEELICFLSSFFKIPKIFIEIISGKTNRNKSILVKEVSLDSALSQIMKVLDATQKEKKETT